MSLPLSSFCSCSRAISWRQSFPLLCKEGQRGGRSIRLFASFLLLSSSTFLIEDPGSLFFAFVFYCHSERSEESRRHFTSGLCPVVTRFHAAQVIDLAEVRRGKFFRLVAAVITVGENLSDLLLEQPGDAL